MDKHPESDNHEVDESLAKFTDQVWSSDSQGKREPEDHDPELVKLEGAVLRVKNGLGRKIFEPEMMERIRKRLISEWGKSSLAKPAENVRKASAKRRSGWVNQKLTLVQLGFAFVLLAIVAVVLIPEVQSDLSAAASRIPGVIPILVLFGIAAVLALVFFFRRK